MRVAIKSSALNWTLGSFQLLQGQAYLAKQQLLGRSVLLMTWEDKRRFLNSLVAEFENRDSSGCTLEQAQFVRLIEILLQTPSAREGYACHKDFSVNPNLSELLSTIFSHDFLTLGDERTATPSPSETRDQVWKRMFEVPAQSASRAVIWDQFALTNLLDEDWASRSTAWSLGKFCEAAVPEIVIVSTAEWVTGVAKDQQLAAQLEVWKSTTQGAIQERLQEMLPKGKGLRIDLRVRPSRKYIHDRAVRFDFHPVARQHGTAVSLGKGLESFPSRKMFESTIGPLSWEQLQQWDETPPGSHSHLGSVEVAC